MPVTLEKQRPLVQGSCHRRLLQAVVSDTRDAEKQHLLFKQITIHSIAQSIHKTNDDLSVVCLSMLKRLCLLNVTFRQLIIDKRLSNFDYASKILFSKTLRL